MKTWTKLSLTLALSATFATAAQAKPLASLVQTGGFCPGGCPTTTITLDDSGWVSTRVKNNDGSEVLRKNFLFLNKDLIQALKKDMSSYASAPLVDMQADQPICMDIPLVRYQAYLAGKTVVIGEDKNCHEYRPISYKGSRLISLLKGAEAADQLLAY